MSRSHYSEVSLFSLEGEGLDFNPQPSPDPGPGTEQYKVISNGRVEFSDQPSEVFLALRSKAEQHITAYRVVF